MTDQEKTLHEKRVAAGQKGGAATLARYGRAHFARAGAKSSPTKNLFEKGSERARAAGRKGGTKSRRKKITKENQDGTS